jgi:hypothetical protein
VIFARRYSTGEIPICRSNARLNAASDRTRLLPPPSLPVAGGLRAARLLASSGSASDSGSGISPRRRLKRSANAERDIAASQPRGLSDASEKYERTDSMKMRSEMRLKIVPSPPRQCDWPAAPCSVFLGPCAANFPRGALRPRGAPYFSRAVLPETVFEIPAVRAAYAKCYFEIRVRRGERRTLHASRRSCRRGP